MNPRDWKALSLSLILLTAFVPAIQASNVVAFEADSETDLRPLPVVVVLIATYVVIPLAVGLAANAIYSKLTADGNVCEAEIEVHVNSDVGDEDASCNTQGCTARTDLEEEIDPDNPWQDSSWGKGRAVTKENSFPTKLEMECLLEELSAGVLPGHSARFISNHNWRGRTAKGTIPAFDGGEPEMVGASIRELSLSFADTSMTTTDTCDLFDGELRIKASSNLRAVKHSDGTVVFDEDLLGCELVLGPPAECGVGAPPTILSNPCGLSFSFFPDGYGYKLILHPYETEPIALGNWAEGDTLDFYSTGDELEISFDRPGDPLYQGACCLHEGGCEIRFEFECPPSQGTYMGDDVACDPSPCATPTVDKSWGAVKSMFN